MSVNTFTATDDCSRFYRSLPPTNAVVLRVYRYVPGYRIKVLRGANVLYIRFFRVKKPFPVTYDMCIYLKYSIKIIKKIYAWQRDIDFLGGVAVKVLKSYD